MSKIEYSKILQIEILNECSSYTFAKLLNFNLKNNVAEDSFYAQLLNQLGELKQRYMFDMPDDELDDLQAYWIVVDRYVRLLIKHKNVKFNDRRENKFS